MPFSPFLKVIDTISLVITTDKDTRKSCRRKHHEKISLIITEKAVFFLFSIDQYDLHSINTVKSSVNVYLTQKCKSTLNLMHKKQQGQVCRRWRQGKAASAPHPEVNVHPGIQVSPCSIYRTYWGAPYWRRSVGPPGGRHDSHSGRRIKNADMTRAWRHAQFMSPTSTVSSIYSCQPDPVPRSCALCRASFWGILVRGLGELRKHRKKVTSPVFLPEIKTSTIIATVNDEA